MESITKLREFSKTNLRDEAYVSLKRSILTGEISQGQSLTINQICKLTNFSATPIREALLKLEQDGIVSRLQNGNFIVRRFSREEIESILDLRVLLETFAMEKAIKHVQPEHIKWLVETVSRAEKCIAKGEISETSELNTAFHHYLYDLSNDPILVGILQSLSDKIWMNSSTAISAPGKAENAIRDHKKMIEALRGQNANELKKIVKKHILQARQIILHTTGKE
jgi:DNA-binding GntR family transcriptional regulator